MRDLDPSPGDRPCLEDAAGRGDDRRFGGASGHLYGSGIVVMRRRDCGGGRVECRVLLHFQHCARNDQSSRRGRHASRSRRQQNIAPAAAAQCKGRDDGADARVAVARAATPVLGLCSLRIRNKSPPERHKAANEAAETCGRQWLLLTMSSRQTRHHAARLPYCLRKAGHASPRAAIEPRRRLAGLTGS